MPFLPLPHQFFAICFDPDDHFIAQTAGPLAVSLQRGYIDNDVNASANQMAMRRAVVPLANFQPVLVAEAPLGCHETPL
jgi:hypothetical protein